MGTNKPIPAKKKMEIVPEGLEADNMVSFCRQMDIAEAPFHNGKNKLLENGS